MIGVLLVTLSLLTLLSLVSFTPSDLPLFGSGPSDAASPRQNRNMIGTVGATLAVVLFRLVGAAAYIVPFLLAMLGARCFVEGPLTVTVRSAGGSLLSVLFLSSLLHLEVTAVPTLISGLVYRGMAGGLVGQLIAEGLKSAFASTGAHIIVAAGLVISLLLATPISLADLRRRVPGWLQSLTEAVAAIAPALPERAERGEKVKKGKSTPVKINRSLPVGEDEGMVAVETPPEPVSTGVSARIVEEPIGPEEEPEVITTKRVSTGYVLPDPRELLSDPSGPLERMTDEELKAQSEVLVRALLSFGIEGKITEVHPGPVVTMYEFEPAPGVKVARIVNLDRDLALALKATSLRIVAPIPGKSVVGIEVPNRYRETVSLKEVLTSEVFTRSRSKLTLALGKDIFGVPVTADLKTMPHLLVAGATGAGKSV
ncbi:MAG TPA: DNA translocase FtsK 4TM domain-containing protein, partial [Nitrospiraceae bacterium]|nr:DNA translocase FtsK 4TM domain-containing protein [Nitrospiraceae bacterium]